MGRTALRLAKLVSADRGLIVLATLFGVRTANSPPHFPLLESRT